MWLDHIDRDQLTTSVQMYAALRPQADRVVVTAGDYAARDAAVLRQQADKHRKKIQAAIRDGKGLHALERDQLDLALRDIDALAVGPGHCVTPIQVGNAQQPRLWTPGLREGQP
ncbi:hypothetical protein ACPESR_31480 [Nocardia testacea]|uniref:hypothetical protein n=1 Tax=Nocardia testacea TaxID=248551 RepID=UPI003C2C6926